MMKITIDEYDNGYRPTATGRIGDRQFVFRMMNGAWGFYIAKEGVDHIWWHSEDKELEFSTEGTCDMAWHTESVPEFLAGLEQYLRYLGLTTDERQDVVAQALAAAEHLFAAS